MKFKLLMITILSLILLSGCNKPISHDSIAQQGQRKSEIKVNQKRWQGRLEKVKVIDQPNFKKAFTTVPNGYDDESMSLQSLKNANQFVVKGQIVNLNSMIGRPLAPETKATIYIEKIISGDKSLENKTIKTVFAGGFARVRDLYSSFGINNPQEVVYYPSETFLIPKIGTQVIMGIKKFRPENIGQKKLYKRFNLNTNNFYTINNPETTFWVKSHHKYKLNNPAFYQEKSQYKFKNIYKLTNRFNQNRI